MQHYSGGCAAICWCLAEMPDTYSSSISYEPGMCQGAHCARLAQEMLWPCCFEGWYFFATSESRSGDRPQVAHARFSNCQKPFCECLSVGSLNRGRKKVVRTGKIFSDCDTLYFRRPVC